MHTLSEAYNWPITHKHTHTRTLVWYIHTHTHTPSEAHTSHPRGGERVSLDRERERESMWSTRLSIDNKTHVTNACVTWQTRVSRYSSPPSHRERAKETDRIPLTYYSRNKYYQQSDERDTRVCHTRLSRDKRIIVSSSLHIPIHLSLRMTTFSLSMSDDIPVSISIHKKKIYRYTPFGAQVRIHKKLGGLRYFTTYMR